MAIPFILLQMNNSYAGCMASDPVGSTKVWKLLTATTDVTSGSGMSLWECKFSINSNNSIASSSRACIVSVPQTITKKDYYDIVSGSISYQQDCTYKLTLNTKSSVGSFAIGFNFSGVLTLDKQEISGTTSQNWFYSKTNYAGGQFSMIRIQ